MDNLPREMLILIAQDSIPVYRGMVRLSKGITSALYSGQDNSSRWKEYFTICIVNLGYYKYEINWTGNGIFHQECNVSKPRVDSRRHCVLKLKWSLNGEFHRDGDEPAIIYDDGEEHWYQYGALHRDGDKPAVICSNGDKEWWKNGTRYR